MFAFSKELCMRQQQSRVFKTVYEVTSNTKTLSVNTPLTK